MASFSFFSTAASTRQIHASILSASKLAGVTPASRLEVRPAPEMVSSGIPQIDDLTGGLPRGCLTELCGSASSGRTSVLLAALAAATQRQDLCALVDVSDALDPLSAAAAGAQFERLLWVRCGTTQRKFPPQRHPSGALSAGSDTEKKRKETDRAGTEGPVEQALRATDLLLQSGGFGLVIMDLGGVPLKLARRIPLASWFRFQRAVEHTPTVLFIITPAPCAQSCTTLLLKVVGKNLSGKKLSALSYQLSAKNVFCNVEGHGFSHVESASKKIGAFAPKAPTHTQLLDALHIEAELLRSRLERKPVRSVTATFTAMRVS